MNVSRFRLLAVSPLKFGLAISGVLLVVSTRESRFPKVRHALGRLQHVRSPIIGAILNKFEGPSSIYSQYYGYSYRYGGYGYWYSPYHED